MAADEKRPMRSPIRWFFDSAILILGAVIALRLALGYVQPILPMIIIATAVIAAVVVIIAIVRWRRSRW